MASIQPHRVNARLRIRAGVPSVNAPKLAVLDVGATVHPEARVVGDAVAGNAAWFRLPGERYVWTGGCSPFAGGSGPPSLDVRRRADGTVAVLTESEMKTTYGDFEWAPGRKRGAIRITDGWNVNNLVSIDTPILGDEGYSKITVHKLAADPFTRVFDAIAKAGLEEVIRTCAGTFVPRHKGWDPSRGLSSHSWGIAIDLNAEWNGYGRTPAALGEIGSLREIVGLFEEQGFAWGGYFQPQKWADGMHFELARRRF